MKELTDRGGAFAEMLLMDGLAVAQAWQMLHDPNVCGKLDMEAYLDLCIAAGYSKRAAEKAACEWGFKRLSKGMEV